MLPIKFLVNSTLTGNILGIMDSKSEARLGGPHEVSASNGGHGDQVSFLPPYQYSKDRNDDKTAQKVSGKILAPALEHDPSFSGDFDPYTYIILGQL